MNEEEKRGLIAVARTLGCTLNGEPAAITGAKNPFATIRQFDDPYLETEFSWPAVKRIMTKYHGKFEKDIYNR